MKSTQLETHGNYYKKDANSQHTHTSAMVRLVHLNSVNILFYRCFVFFMLVEFRSVSPAHSPDT